MSGPIPKWFGQVSADGARIQIGGGVLECIGKRGGFARWLATKRGQKVWISVQPFVKRRSLNQNSYWWGYIVPTLADHLGYLDYEHEALHDAIVRHLVGMRPGGDPRLQIRASTAGMTTTEFNTLIHDCQIWAAEQLGVVLEDPDSEWQFRRRS